MIFYTILLFFIWLLGLFLSPMVNLPDASLPSNVSDFISLASQALTSFHALLPYTIDALLAVLLLLIGIEVALWFYKGIRWVYQKIPGVN